MHSRIRIYNRQGVPVGEVSATTKRSWMLNNIGECTFVISKRNPKLEQGLIEFGNIVFVTNPYTKPWCGIIDTPRTWTRNGPRITAFSAEVLLSYRDNLSVNPSSSLLNSLETLRGKAGSLFQQIVVRMNDTEDTLVRTGVTFMSGADRQETLNTDLLTHTRNIAERSGNDFDITAAVQDNNTISFLANWYEKKQLNSNIVLEEGVNIELKDEMMVEQGIISNSIVAAGVAELETPSIGAIYQDSASITRFGTRQASVTFGTVSEVATLVENVKTLTARSAYPRATASVTCVDKSMYKSISEGDTVRLVLHKAGFMANKTLGFNKSVRVLGMQANDDRNTVDLILDEMEGL